MAHCFRQKKNSRTVMAFFNIWGASIYDVRTEGGGGKKIPQICGQTFHKIRTKGGVKKGSKNPKILRAGTSYMEAPRPSSILCCCLSNDRPITFSSAPLPFRHRVRGQNEGFFARFIVQCIPLVKSTDVRSSRIMGQ